VFLYGFNQVRLVIDTVVGVVQDLIARPSGGRPVPVVGWLGVVAVATYLACAVGNLRVGLLTVTGLVLLGLQGLWLEAMNTLALTLAAVVLCLVIGIPLGLWAGLSDRVHRLLLPVLDFMQTMPTFVYLAPLTLFFLIGPASATVATLIYALPPVVRLTAHGVREVPQPVVEATTFTGFHRRPEAAQGAAAHGQAHHRPRHQPDDHGRVVDGHDRGAHRCTWPRQDGHQGAGDARRRRGVPTPGWPSSCSPSSWTG